MENLDSAAALEYVDPDRTFSQRISVVPEELIEVLGVCVDIKFHLTLFDDLEARFLNAGLDVKTVRERMILDDGDGTGNGYSR